jgi:hypothetical protein
MCRIRILEKLDEASIQDCLQPDEEPGNIMVFDRNVNDCQIFTAYDITKNEHINVKILGSISCFR